MASIKQGTLGPPPDPVAVLRAHRSSVDAVSFYSTSTNLLFSGDAEGELKIWDVIRRRALSSSRVHSPNAGVIGIATTELLEDKILSQGRDGTVKCWQLLGDGLSREPLITICSNSYHFCKLSPLIISTVPTVSEIEAQSQDHENQDINNKITSTSTDGVSYLGKSLIAIAGEEPSVAEIWSVDDGTRVQQLRHPPDVKSAGMCMALQLFVPPGIEGTPNLLAGYEDGSMALWDLRSCKSPCVSTRFHTEPVLSICLDGTCQGGVSGAADDKTVFFNVDNEKKALLLRKEIIHGRAGIGDVSVRSDGKIAATAGWDHRVRIYDYHRRRPLAILKYHSSAVTGVAFSKDNRLLASSSRDTCIALWSLYAP